LEFAELDGVFAVHSGVIVVGICIFGLDDRTFEIRSSKSKGLVLS
jgi:hypothetical protein